MNAFGDNDDSARMSENEMAEIFSQTSITDSYVESDDDEDFDIKNFNYPGHDYSGMSNRERIPQHQGVPSGNMIDMLYTFGSGARYKESLDHWSHKISTKPCEIMKFYRRYDLINGMKSGMTKKHYFREMALNKTVWYEKVVKPEEFLVQVYRNRIEDNYVFGGGDENLCGLYTYPLGTNVEYEIFHDFLKFIKLAHLKSIIPASFDFKKCMTYASETLISAIDESCITDIWKKKENNFNSLSGMRKVGEQIYGEYAADTSKAFEAKVGERAKRAIKTKDAEFFKNIGGKAGWFEFYHGLDLSKTREANGDEQFSDDDEDVSESTESVTVSGDSEIYYDIPSKDSEFNEKPGTKSTEDTKLSKPMLSQNAQSLIDNFKKQLDSPDTSLEKLDKIKDMEQTLTTLTNQKVDTSKLTKFSVPPVTNYNDLNLDGYTVKTGDSQFMSVHFNMYESDQIHPVIVQAAEKNDLVILIKLIRHANKLPEFDEKLMASGSNVTGVNGNGDTCDRKFNKIDHKNFVFKEEALNASRILTEVAEKHGYDKSYEWYSALKSVS